MNRYTVSNSFYVSLKIAKELIIGNVHEFKIHSHATKPTKLALDALKASSHLQLVSVHFEQGTGKHCQTEKLLIFFFLMTVKLALSSK